MHGSRSPIAGAVVLLTLAAAGTGWAVSDKNTGNLTGTNQEGLTASTAPFALASASTEQPTESAMLLPLTMVSRAAFKESAAGTPSKNSLLIPVAGVRAKDLVDTYTQARSEGRTHDALDIPAPKNTPVLATANGTVLKLFQSKRGGTTLYELDPDGHTVYYYAHLSGYAPGIAEGQTVTQGTTLGFVGNTGNAGPDNYHLHFEVTTVKNPKQFWQGVPTNPFPLLGGIPSGKKEGAK